MEVSCKNKLILFVKYEFIYLKGNNYNNEFIYLTWRP